MLVLHWNVDPIDGYRDLIPDHWFIAEGTESGLEHVFLGPNGHKYFPKCSIEVDSSSAVLRYGGQYARINAEEDACLPGDLKFIFASKERQRVKAVLWRNENEEEYHKAAATVVAWNFLDTLEGLEGGQELVAHLRRERDPALVGKKIDEVIGQTGALRCEACGFDFEEQYAPLGDRFCEVHHRVPLAHGVRRTQLHELAVLCANCHRMIHRTNPMMSVEEFAARYVIRPRRDRPC